MITELKKRFHNIGVEIPDILLPAPGVEIEKFAVIACDQHSAEPAYWEETKAIVGESPSALSLMLPEVYLEDKDAPTKEELWKNMQEYLDKGVLASIGEGFVYLKRTTPSGTRKGLMAALDLDAYSYVPGDKALIRATEKTVQERLPARVEIRRGAPLEMPHVMVLIDDRDDLLMKALEEGAAGQPSLYDFELMQGGGHLTGYAVQEPRLLEKVADIMEKLTADSGDGMLFAVGDGNHSLAAAKAYWDEIKTGIPEEERESHPAKYALVEVVNVYDEALPFLPIHRILMNVDPRNLQEEVGFDAANPPSLQELQPKLDQYLDAHPEAKIEYIHGENECLELQAQDPARRLAILFGAFDKSSVFRMAKEGRVFVRKSFSIGEAFEKRYYLEARKIVK